MFVNRAGTMVLPFITLYLTQDRGLSVAIAGRIMGVYGFGSIAGSYIGGWLSDRIGTERTQQLSLIGSGLGFFWLSALRGLMPITIAVFLVSTVSEAYRPAVMASFAQRAPADRQAQAFALLRLAANLGWGVGPAVGGFLALHSYRLLFLVDGATCWLAALLLGLALPAAQRTPAARATQSGRAAISPWSDGPFLLLLVLVATLALAFFQVFSTMPVYFRTVYGLRESAIGMLMGLNALLIVAFEMVLIQWVGNRKRMPLIGLGAVLVCGGLALMPFGTSLAFAALTIVVWTVGEMIALPLLNAVVGKRAAPGSSGRYMGLYTMAYSVAFMLSPVVGALIYERFGPERLWYCIGALAVPLLFGALALHGPLSREPHSVDSKDLSE
jgi:predicted MFS family arabinose efflux permease